MKYVCYVALALLLVFDCNAQTKPSKVFNLDECIRIAAGSNYDIKKAASTIETTKAEVKNAYGNYYLPSADLSASAQKQLKSSGVNSYSVNAGLSYDLFKGFGQEADYKGAKSKQQYYEMAKKYTEKQVTLDVINSYTGIVKEMQILKVREENFRTGQKELEKINAQYQAGTSPVTDVYAQEAELGSRELEVVTAGNNLNVSKANLLNIMGQEPDIDAQFDEASLPVDVTDEDIAKFKSAIGGLESAIKTSLDNRVDYLAYNASLQSLESGVDAAKSSYYPTVTASGGWSWSNNELSGFGDKSSPYIGLNLRVPIFENYSTDYQVEAAKQQVIQKQIDKAQLEQSIRVDIKTRFLSLTAAEKQLEITSRALRSAEKNYEAAKESYNAGTYNITDLLNANYQLINARINRINAVYNYYSVQKGLLFSMGLL